MNSQERGPGDGPRSPPKAAQRLGCWAWVVIGVGLALSLGLLSRWMIFEYDVFWQVRAGNEILAGSGIQRIDRWSYTAGGKPWFNFQWLATVTDALAYRAGGGYGALSWLRALLVAVWALALTSFVRAGVGQRARYAPLALLLVPWVYLACVFRLQMRPDLFAACCDAALLALWLFPDGSRITGRSRRGLSLAILLLWSNFHSGTLPFGIFLFGAAVSFDRDPRREEGWLEKGAWIGAGALTWLATPLGWHTVEVFIRTVVTYDSTITRNPDYQPFELHLLSFRSGGYSLLLWSLYTASAAAGTVHLALRKEKLPGAFRRLGFVAAVGVALTLATLARIRAIHYQMMFLLPVIAGSAHALLARASTRQRWGIEIALFSCAALLWGFMIPNHVRYVAKPIGSRVFDAGLPVQSAAFLEKFRPRGRLLNAYQFGGYLVAEAPDYPVAVDGREIPFLGFLAQLNAAREHPDRYAAFLLFHEVNAVLETPPGTWFDPTRGFTDTHAFLYPPSEWALVFFDNASVLYLRRIPEHAALIAQHEYHAIRRGLPYNYGALFRDLSDATRAAHEAELDRCLSENDRNVYCLTGKAAFYRKRGDDAEAVPLLEHALEVAPNSPEALLELSSVLRSQGRTSDAIDLERRLEYVVDVSTSR